MINRDVKVLLAAWGQWTRDNQDSGNCKSPSQMLINSAPVNDSDVKRYARYADCEHIDDDTALQVERAVTALKKYSERLYVALEHMLENKTQDDNLFVSAMMYTVITHHYRYGESFKQLAKDSTARFGIKITDVKIKSILERGCGFIEGQLNA